jgi:ornithine cyclodeaminase/alanine dehydrogenase
VYLREDDVGRLVSPADAVDAVEASLRRLAARTARNRSRVRISFETGILGVASAVDDELGLAASTTTADADGRGGAVVALFGIEAPELLAVVEADRLVRLASGAASAVAARHLARAGARSVGVIGCGAHALAQVECLRAALPTIDRVLAYCPERSALTSFCERAGADPAESGQEAAEQDVVVTATTSRDPVVRGEWLRDGALVCAVGANAPASRELDNVALERAAFVCCDLLEQARLEAADLIEPVETRVLDWLEVHELHEVAAGATSGRLAPSDVVVFKATGIPACALALGAVAMRAAAGS